MSVRALVAPRTKCICYVGMTATLGLYPLETLRTRLAMGDYDNMLHAVRAVAAEEGLMAFYQVSPLHTTALVRM